MDHDVSFRAGIGADGTDTYTPRTLIYDLKGAFGTLRRENALYELQHEQDPLSQGPWSGSSAPLRLPTIPPSAYQQALDSGSEPPRLTQEAVRFWSDYNHVFYHPRSIVQLNEYEVNSSLMPFERFQTGEELFATLDREHDLLDRDLRPFLEECDQLQGIQIFSGTDDAWGGFASKYLEHVADELGKGCRWVFGLQNTQRSTRTQQMLQTANLAQSLYALNSSASVHLPIANAPRNLPGYVELNVPSRWHTSAFQCVAIESVTLPARLRRAQSARATLDAMETILNGDGKRRLAASSFSLLDPASPAKLTNGHTASSMTNGFHEDEDAKEGTHLDIDLFPDLAQQARSRQRSRRAHEFSTLELSRGESERDMDSESETGETQRHRVGDFRTSSSHTPLLFPVLSSYPTVVHFADNPKKLGVKLSVNTSTRLSSSVRAVEREARRLIGIEDREALCDGLAVMAEEYEEGWMSDDESDDDAAD